LAARSFRLFRPQRRKHRLGRLPKSLAAAGVNPADVDDVVITHIHPDHVAKASNGGYAFVPVPWNPDI
jgi:glyoxylase-like metal-dependent hydrolase (beta-lactamase superfamily II)